MTSSKIEDSILEYTVNKYSELHNPYFFVLFDSNYIEIKYGSSKIKLLSNFGDYKCYKKEEEDYEIKINAYEFKRWLGNIESGQKIKLYITEEDCKRLVIYFLDKDDNDNYIRLKIE